MRLLGRSSLVFCLVLAVWYTFPGDFAFASKYKKEKYIVLTYQPGSTEKGKWKPWGSTRRLKIKYSDCLNVKGRFKTLTCKESNCANIVADDIISDVAVYVAAVRTRKGLLSVAKPLKVIPQPKDSDLTTGACVLAVYGTDYSLRFRLKGHSYVDIHKTDGDPQVNTARLFLNAKVITEVTQTPDIYSLGWTYRNNKVPTVKESEVPTVKESEVPTDEAAGVKFSIGGSEWDSDDSS